MKKNIFKQYISNKFFICLFFILILDVLLKLTLSKLVQIFLDSLLNNKVQFKVIEFYILIGFLIYLGELTKKFLATKCSWRVCGAIRKKIAASMINCKDSFFKNTDTGEWLLIFNDDIKTIETFLENSVVYIISGSLTFIGVVIAVSNENFVIALFFFVYLFVSVLYIVCIQSKKQKYLDLERAEKSDYVSSCYEWYKVRSDINNFGKLKYVVEQMRIKNCIYEKSVLIAQKALYSIWIASLLMIFIGNIITLIGGGVLSYENYISIGTVYLFYSYGQQIKEPLDNLQVLMRSMLSVNTSMKRIEDVVNYPKIERNVLKLDIKKIADVKINIDIEKHSYNSTDILKSIHISINSRDKIALIGESGCGKSTLCRLISRQETIQNGNISLNGINIEKYDENSYRKNVLYLSENPEIFSASLKDNLTLFNPNIGNDEIAERLSLLGMIDSKFHDFNFLTNIDKLINKNEVSYDILQLINILRIGFVDPDVIIFDEAITNINIDKEFLDIITKLVENKTCIFVTHEVEKTIMCNRFIKMEKGSIVYDE